MAQAEAAAPSAEAVPSGEEAAKKEEPKEENPGDKDELWMHKWGFGPMETIQSEAFYRMIGRTGITYGDTFRMVKRVASSDAAAMMRCGPLSPACLVWSPLVACFGSSLPDLELFRCVILLCVRCEAGLEVPP